MTGGIKSSEENRAQDAACSWKTGEYLDAYGKPTGERFITTERISARFDSNYVNDADGSACVRYIVCSDDDCICIRLFKYGKYPVTNAGSTTKYYIIFFTDTEGKRHMLEGYALPGGSEIYLDNTYQYPYDAGDGFVTRCLLRTSCSRMVRYGLLFWSGAGRLLRLSLGWRVWGLWRLRGG